MVCLILMKKPWSRGQYGRNVAQLWDQFIDWEKREKQEGSWLIDLLRAHSDVSRIYDVACGTGFHSVLLARSGFDVHAFDSSKEMIAKAESNFSAHNVAIPIERISGWSHFHSEEPCDGLVCLGNSISHLLKKRQRLAALEAFANTLRTGGVFVVDVRNWDALFSETLSPFYYHGQVSIAAKRRRNRIKCTYQFPSGQSFVLEFAYLTVAMVIEECAFAGLRFRQQLHNGVEVQNSSDSFEPECYQLVFTK